MLTSDPTALLDQLVDRSIANFDVPLDVHKRAVARYEELGDWLADYWGAHPAGGVVYPQGSIRLGTMIRPVTPGAEDDIDLVCRRDLLKWSTTRKAMKADVGGGIAAYVATRPEGNPRQSEG